MTDPKKERYRRIRGAILKLLAQQHPGPLDIKELHFLLDDMGYTILDEELQSHLIYLSDRTLISKEKHYTGAIETTMVRITSDGLNVIDGFQQDIGVDTRF